MIGTHVEIYCDGACLGNPGPGGYAALLIHKAKRKTERVVSGNEPHTTNNRMELRAAIEGIKALRRPCRIALYSDSKYLVLGMNEWMNQWLKTGFKTSARKPIKNQDLWQELSLLKDIHQITWHWVKGHSGHEENERVDQMALEQAYQAKHAAFFKSDPDR